MKNKQHIIVFDIPLGMYRPVEQNATRDARHPCRDAGERCLCIFYRALYS